MDDLIGGFLLMMLVGMAIAAAIAIALAMAALGAAVGSLLVGIGGAWAFAASLGRRVWTRGGADRRPLAPEPAFELYVLGQLGRDLRSAAGDAWEAMQRLRAMTGDFAAQHNEGATMPLGIGALVGGFLGTALGAVVAAVLTLPVVLVAGVVIAGAWALIGVLRTAEAVRRRARRTGYECPVDHERFDLPVYVCPGCGAEHKRLVPGRWGIVKRECQCKEVALPTMVLNGRQRVRQQCPSGHAIAGIVGFAEMLRVALVAGPRAGKSTFLAGALYELDRLSEDGTLALAVVEGSRKDFDAALEDLQHGRLPAKTQISGNPALVAEIQGGGRSRALSLYDVAGESYGGEDEIRDLRFLEVPSGLVLLVDPLALERFSADRSDEIAAAEDRLRPSPVSPIRVLERMVGALAAAGASTEKLPLAVVVCKADALDVGAEIDALGQSLGERAVPEWLERQGAGNFVRAVEADFSKVGWFHASALGRVPDPLENASFVPSGTADPVLWLLRQNGVVPASEPFSPAKAAERLSGAVAADFPPISPRGLAWRAIPAAVLSVAVLAGLGLGAATAAQTLDDNSSQPAFADAAVSDESSSDDTSSGGDATTGDATTGDDDTTAGASGALESSGDLPVGRYVRLGSFRSPEGAERERERLSREGIESAVADSNLYTDLLPAFNVIVVGPTFGASDEDRVARSAKRAGITGTLVGDLTPIDGPPDTGELEGSHYGTVKQVDAKVDSRNRDRAAEVYFDPGGESGGVIYEDPFCETSLTLDGTDGGAVTYVEDTVDGACLEGGRWWFKLEGSELLSTWWLTDGVTFRVGRLDAP